MTEEPTRVQRRSIVSQEARAGEIARSRVLLVEDDAFVAALVAATLEDAGIDVDWFSTARSALTAAEKCRYDACLLGVGPRDTNGVLLAEELAEIDARAPVVVIAESRDDLRFRLGLTVVTRPFAPGALVGALERASNADREAA